MKGQWCSFNKKIFCEEDLQCENCELYLHTCMWCGNYNPIKVHTLDFKNIDGSNMVLCDNYITCLNRQV
jgi:hypothetical protein